MLRGKICVCLSALHLAHQCEMQRLNRALGSLRSGGPSSLLLGRRGGKHGYHSRSSPLGEVRIPLRTAARAHFVVVNKGAGKFYLIFDTR